MNQKKLLPLFLILTLAFWGCEDKVTKEVTYMANVPVYMSTKEFKSAVKKTAQQEVKEPGKIYIKYKYLYVNEVNKGIHVYDNSNPSSPEYICFINIPGNVDFAIKNNLLYADSYIDLVAINIADPANPVEVNRYANAFPEIYPVYDYRYPVTSTEPDKGVVVGWKIEQITVEKVENNYYYRGGPIFMNDVKSNGGATAGGVGIAGSMARFAIKSDVLYAINRGFEIKIFDISYDNIIKKDSITSLWNIETLFAYNNMLFIGSNNGMLIYDIHDARHPTFVSQYNHATSCDPVVVNDDYAFVTLRSGNNCNNMINELNVVSLKDIQNPKLLMTYPMYNPHGLGIDENLLFICDGDAGLKVYDATDVLTIDKNMIKHFEDIKTFDVIPYNDILIMTGKDGIFQYDYSDIKDIREISHITINK